MKKKNNISLGPGAPSLILIFVVLSMAILGMLSLMTARNDLKLSERSAEVIEAVYRLNTRAEETLQALCTQVQSCAAEQAEEEDFWRVLAEQMPDGAELEEGVISWQETDDTRILDCAVEVLTGSGNPRLVWVRHNLTTTIAGEEDWADDSF